MIPYLLIFLFATLIYIMASQRATIMVWIFICCFIFMVGVRDMIGGFDVYIYGEVFELYKGPLLFLQQKLEKGFLSYFWLLQLISERREFMFAITAFLMIGLHFIAIKNTTSNVGMSVFIYFCKFFFFTFVYLRQGLSVACVWLAVSLLLNNRNIFWTLLLTMIGISFHNSAIILIPFLFIASRKLPVWVMLITGITVLVLAFSGLFDSLFTSFAGQLDNEKLNLYIEKAAGVNIFYIIEGILVIGSVIVFKRKFESSRFLTIVANGLFFYGVLEIASATNASFARFTWYYFIFVIVAIPYMLNELTDKKLHDLAKLIVYIYFSILFFKLLFMLDGGDFIPYKAFFINSRRTGVWEWMEYR